jgi:uncharacterized membrane protein
LAPILEEYYFYSLSNYFYNVLSSICHQYPTRSLWIMNRPMGLCSRCFAVYASFSISLIFLPLLKNRRHIALLCFLFLPLILDGLLQYYNIGESDNFSRVLSGVLFGVSSSVIYKYFMFNLIDTLKATIKRERIIKTYKYINLIIGSGLVFLTNFYGIAACF